MFPEQLVVVRIEKYLTVVFFDMQTDAEPVPLSPLTVVPVFRLELPPGGGIRPVLLTVFVAAENDAVGKQNHVRRASSVFGGVGVADFVQADRPFAWNVLTGFVDGGSVGAEPVVEGVADPGFLASRDRIFIGRTGQNRGDRPETGAVAAVSSHDLHENLVP